MTLKCPYFVCRTARQSRDASSTIQGVSELLLGYQLGTQIWVVLPSPVDAVGLSPWCDHASSHTTSTASLWLNLAPGDDPPPAPAHQTILLEAGAEVVPLEQPDAGRRIPTLSPASIRVLFLGRIGITILQAGRGTATEKPKWGCPDSAQCLTGSRAQLSFPGGGSLMGNAVSQWCQQCHQ